MSGATTAEGPDFSVGIAIADVPLDGTLAGRVGEHPVLLSRLGGQLFAVSGSCTHYGAALGEGLIHDGTVRCPLHHACFDLRTGRALHAPALDDLECWKVRVEGGRAQQECGKTAHALRVPPPLAVKRRSGRRLTFRSCGAARAFQESEEAGAFSGLAMGLCGLVTAVLFPLGVFLILEIVP